ncbi:MAG TPA: hypothetical protein VJC03_03770, partial [bacterium]|nr:hypothetical protein [bacterium]
WMENPQREKNEEKKPGKPDVTMKDVREYLSGCEKKDLVDIIVEQMGENDRLRQRLFLKTAKARSSGIDMRAYRNAINSAVSVRDYISYDDAYDYFQGIHEVIDSIEELLKEGYGSEAMELSEYALSRIEEYTEAVDDSDGGTNDVAERLAEIHFKACMIARPDPEALAKRLFEWELRSELRMFSGSAEQYGEILGEKGLAVFRALAEREWEKVPALKSGDDYKYFQIQHIMESLARRSGNIEELVAVKSRMLTHAYRYLEIAEIYVKAKHADKALEWAEKGLKAFPDQTDSRLLFFLADEYHRRRRFSDEMAMIWTNFTDYLNLEAYTELHRRAKRLDEWPEWREKALSFIRGRTNVKKKSSRFFFLES